MTSKHDDNPLNEDLRSKAARFLDAETAAMDTQTRDALRAARLHAAQTRRTPWLQLGGAGLGVALAASLTALVILPRMGSDGVGGAPQHLAQAVPDSAPFNAATARAGDAAATATDATLLDDADSALADDLAFVAWLEENHDPS